MCWRRRQPMPRSSETVAALASALAKAQAELVNPEKSLTATIRNGRPGDGERSFRYAPLSSGLDIVRKTLGQHEIATLQTTAIDQSAGMVHLTTTLAHASGEWIASDWPVCPVAETANPQRMGAALTYARRYALFTLVGIAGEDDLDAPDICMPAPVTGASTTGPSIDGWQFPGPTRGNGRIRDAAKAAGRTVLLTDESAALRDRLLSEISELASQDSAATWAGDTLPAKNTLSHVQLERSPRMADFALWATACETAFWPPGTFLRVYDANRRSAVEDVIEADPVAAFVREIMAVRSTWAGRSSDLLAAHIAAGEDVPERAAGWPRNPRALAGRLRRCQTFLRTVGIDIAFSREGRMGSRMIRMTSLTKSASTSEGNGRHT